MNLDKQLRRITYYTVLGPLILSMLVYALVQPDANKFDQYHDKLVSFMEWIVNGYNDIGS